MSTPGLLCTWHMTQAHILAHASHLSPPQVDCPLSSNPNQDWPPFKGAGPNNLLSTTLTSVIMDSWVLDSIACLVNKGLVVCTLAFCILCLAPPGSQALHGLIAHADRQPTKAGLLQGESLLPRLGRYSIGP